MSKYTVISFVVSLCLTTFYVLEWHDTHSLDESGEPTENELTVSSSDDSRNAHTPAEEAASANIFSTKTLSIKKGSNLYLTLKNSLTIEETMAVINATKKVIDVTTFAPKTKIDLYIDDDENLKQLVINLALTKYIEIVKDEETWIAEIKYKKREIRERHFKGVITSNLWNSLPAEADPQLVYKLTEIFAWQIDFNRNVQKNDRWRLNIEEYTVDGKHAGWGAVIAADYKSSQNNFSAVRFENDDDEVMYYDSEGKSLRRMFLKSPIKFGRITSRFSMQRFHPILKRIKPHLGVDYGAPRGTPIMAVGSGRVVTAQRKGGGGKTVVVRHNSVYRTAYKHLDRYGKNIRAGKWVEMGDIIGYVGATGLATGPHLHFEFYKAGRVVDPLKIEFPQVKPLTNTQLTAFQKISKKELGKLPPWAELAAQQD